MTPPPGTPPPPGCWTTTCTPPGPPAGTSRPGRTPKTRRRPPGSAPPVSTLRQAADWLEAERANLHAAAGYAAATARPLYAMSIPAAMDGFLQTRGYWDQGLVLHQAALATARGIGDRAGQARALMLLSPMQTVTGDTPAAVASATGALRLYRDLGDRAGQAEALTMIGLLYMATDDYPAAAAELRQALELFCDLGHRRGQGDALNTLGQVHRWTGDYRAAAASLRQALDLHRDTGHRSGQAAALSNLGAVQQLTGDYPAATATTAARSPELTMSRSPTLAMAASFAHSRVHVYSPAATGASTALRRRRTTAPRCPLRGTTRAAAVFHNSADSAGLPASVKGPCRAHIAQPTAQLPAGCSLREMVR